MINIFSIPVLSAYLYTLTVVAFYGFNSYFNIPYNYIDFSIKDPIVFFFDLSRLILDIFSRISVLVWLEIFISLVIILIIFLFSRVGRWAVTISFVAIIIYAPFGFYKFGNFLASASTNFYTLSSSCIDGATEDLYIAPTLFEGKIIFVPIDLNTHKLLNGLLIREAADLHCQLILSEIGKIQK